MQRKGRHYYFIAVPTDMGSTRTFHPDDGKLKCLVSPCVARSVLHFEGSDM